MTAVVLPVYALLPARFCGMSHIWGCFVLRLTMKEKMNSDKLQKPYQSTQQDCTKWPTRKHNLHWNPSLWVCLFYSDSPWGEVDEASQACSRQPGTRFMFRLCVQYIWIVMTSERSLQHWGNVDRYVCRLMNSSTERLVLRFVSQAGKQRCKQKWCQQGFPSIIFHRSSFRPLLLPLHSNALYLTL